MTHNISSRSKAPSYTPHSCQAQEWRRCPKGARKAWWLHPLGKVDEQSCDTQPRFIIPTGSYDYAAVLLPVLTTFFFPPMIGRPMIVRTDKFVEDDGQYQPRSSRGDSGQIHEDQGQQLQPQPFWKAQASSTYLKLMSVHVNHCPCFMGFRSLVMSDFCPHVLQHDTISFRLSTVFSNWRKRWNFKISLYHHQTHMIINTAYVCCVIKLITRTFPLHMTCPHQIAVHDNNSSHLQLHTEL